MRLGLQLPSFTFPGGTPEIRGGDLRHLERIGREVVPALAA